MYKSSGIPLAKGMQACVDLLTMNLNEGVMMLFDTVVDIEGIKKVYPAHKGNGKAEHLCLPGDGKRLLADCL